MPLDEFHKLGLVGQLRVPCVYFKRMLATCRKVRPFEKPLPGACLARWLALRLGSKSTVLVSTTKSPFSCTRPETPGESPHRYGGGPKSRTRPRMGVPLCSNFARSDCFNFWDFSGGWVGPWGRAWLARPAIRRGFGGFDSIQAARWSAGLE